MRLPNVVHESHPRRIPDTAPDFILEDVWVHGVIGRPLVCELLDAEHEVVETTRMPAKTKNIAALETHPVVCDAIKL